MSKLTQEQARKILDLNPNNAIDPDIAEHQFQTILKGFNYLNQSNQEENKFLYIADEVGLGKTYIALGIASLLRYFASDKDVSSYRDMIVVPKKNLQYKWEKEIKKFTSRNFIPDHNRVKNVLGSTVASSKIYEQLIPIIDNKAEYAIFRNSSFSIPLARRGWDKRLKNKLGDNYSKLNLNDSQKESLKKAFKKFKKADDRDSVKFLYAYLMNLSFQKMDLVIVDEAHNLRHGIGNDASDRNNVLSRLMGKINEGDFETPLECLSWLKSKIEPLANKLILLSATPLNKGCYEIKKQLDVFLPKHKYSGPKNEEKIKKDLSSFMMRGLMTISLGENKHKYSRNQYRHEHRLGNTNKEWPAQAQSIAKISEADPFMAATLGLMQLKTAELLKT